jgi:hypothetical protein
VVVLALTGAALIVNAAGYSAQRLSSPVALVLDDVHVLRNLECRAAVSALAIRAGGAPGTAASFGGADVFVAEYVESEFLARNSATRGQRPVRLQMSTGFSGASSKKSQSHHWCGRAYDWSIDGQQADRF